MPWPGGRRTPTATESGLTGSPERFAPPGRVAVFQPRPGLGDLIWHLPHIRAIASRTQGGRVTLVTKPSTQADQLLRDDPAIERIVWYDRNPRAGLGRHDGVLGFPRLVATLMGCRVQSCVLLHHGAALAAALRLAGIANRYGYGVGAQRRWLNRPPYPPAPAAFTEAFDQASAFTDALGVVGLPEPFVGIDALAHARVRARLASLPPRLAAFGVGSQGEVRQWGAERFAALAAGLLDRGHEGVLLLAAAHEADLVRRIRDALPDEPRMHAVVGWPLPEVAALLVEASLFVGNDSGLLNLRAAVGRPAYGLFGASGPLRHSARLRAIVPPEGARAGMDRITVEQVLRTLDRTDDTPG